MLFKIHRNIPITSQFDSLDVTPEGKLTDATVLMIIPNHNLVGRVTRVTTTSYEGENITAEEHLHMTDAALIEV